MYVYPNFKTKKAFKEAVKKGDKIEAFQPGPFPPTVNGRACIEGPHYPEAHKWYAEVTLIDGIVQTVK